MSGSRTLTCSIVLTLLSMATGISRADHLIVCDWTNIAQDAEVWGFEPFTNYGGNGNLHAGREIDSPWRSYIQFDLTSCLQPGDVILDAQLVTKGIGSAGSPSNYRIQAYKVPGLPGSAWDENTLTWITQPGGNDFLDEVFASGPVPQVTFDVTSAVQGWHANSATNNGLYLSAWDTTLPNTYVIFPSKENQHWDDRKPRLEITVESVDLPDLVIQHFQFEEESYAVGEKPDIEIWVENEGAAPSVSCSVALYFNWPLRPDPQADPPDLVLPVPALDEQGGFDDDWVVVYDYDGTYPRPETIRSWAFIDVYDDVTEVPAGEGDANCHEAERLTQWTLTGWSMKPSLANYAPSGLPDFDQGQQPDWSSPFCNPGQEEELSFCGPTAVANALWYLDSMKSGSGNPYDGQDRCPLVRDYSSPDAGTSSDDHAYENVNDVTTAWDPALEGGSPCQDPDVPPCLPAFPSAPAPGAELIERLAYAMNTDGRRLGGSFCGTGSGQMGQYLNDGNHWLGTGLNASTLLVSQTFNPTVSDLLVASADSDAVTLIGFGAYDPSEDRVFGHWVSLAGGVNSDLEMIAISDPYLDNAMLGGGGFHEPNGHPLPYSRDLHNDAEYVSRDIYEVQSTSGTEKARIVGYGSHDQGPEGLGTGPYEFRIEVLVMLESPATVTVPSETSPERLTSSLGVAPSPFRDVTTIRLTIPRPLSSHLAIYDATGRLVRRLMDGELSSGQMRLVWDARDAGGMRVASGVYFARAMVGDEVHVQRFVVLR